MLIFIDESGDSGFKFNKGSSEIFTIILLVFNEHDEAEACDKRIELLKREIFGNESEEFHFKRNSDKVRKSFFDSMLPYNFFIIDLYGIRKNFIEKDLELKKIFIK